MWHVRKGKGKGVEGREEWAKDVVRQKGKGKGRRRARGVGEGCGTSERERA